MHRTGNTAASPTSLPAPAPSLAEIRSTATAVEGYARSRVLDLAVQLTGRLHTLDGELTGRSGGPPVATPFPFDRPGSDGLAGQLGNDVVDVAQVVHSIGDELEAAIGITDALTAACFATRTVETTPVPVNTCGPDRRYGVGGC